MADSEIKEVLSNSDKGFQSLNLSKKHVESALKWLEVWLTNDMFKEYVPQIKYLIKSEKWDFLLDSFYQVIPFGTGGRRGPVGIGPNRINKWTIQASAQGHSQYLLKQHGIEIKKRGVVLTYDVRKYTEKGVYNDDLPDPVMNLSCKDLAIAAAEVYAANGLKVYMFDDVRSTPELSFSIRYLKAIAGDMFSASHNPPTDNGKKVYDRYGGQLIPPFDQNLVDEVTQNVKKIDSISFKEAKDKGLIEYMDEEVDKAYIDAVCSVSLSDERDINVIYSPLNGTGITSYYPALKGLGFNIMLDPKTSHISGAFENITFNIPNPEVVESFDTLLEYAQNVKADILINSDPDADRMGIMAKHKGEWKYINGNEIGTLLTAYGISKFKSQNKLNKDSVVIKTAVTTSLITKIAEDNNVNCIGDLLVGFKYIAEEMNKLEKEGKIKDFIIASEESNGYITGSHVRDKDGAAAALWICELAAELKKQGKTLIDFLDDIYTRYGYCLNYLTEIRLLGARGMEQISQIMKHLRKNDLETLGRFKVKEKIDKWDGPKHLSETDTASRNILIYHLENIDNTQSMKVTIRPSGTEPKVKMYFEIFSQPADDVLAEKERITAMREELEKNFMKHCYNIIDVDFPDRGFLLFWQLPLTDKMRYFEIEDRIAELKDTAKEQRKEELFKLLEFLGSDPVEKVDKAFKEKYKKGILEFLELKDG